MHRLTHNEVAARIAQDIPDGSYINLGIGLPELVANHLDLDREILVHSENGILGMGAEPPADEVDTDLVNAGKKPVTIRAGGVFFHHADSFSMMRGGHLDLTVMGGMQVSEGADLANWNLEREGEPPAVGGAMDLAVGAKKVFVFMEHTTKDGKPKIVSKCSLPLTGTGVVDRIYTDLGIFACTSDGIRVLEKLASISDEELQAVTGCPLIF